MKPNGYTYHYRSPRKCQKCGKVRKSGGSGVQYSLFEANGEKVCRECAKAMKIL